MKCAKPYMYKGSIPFGCGQCMSCRKNKLRLWQHRLMLEGMMHSESSFITLTYAPEHLPKDGSLCPKDLQDFLKRLRRKLEPKKIRFYAVGEYGEINFRPHYHIALFGYPPCHTPTRNGKGCGACPTCTLIRDSWGLGLTDVGYSRIEKDAAQYVAGYVTKKMTRKDDPRLGGRHPEFARMSNRPGIGFGVIHRIVEFLTSSNGCEAIIRAGDVPMSLSHSGRSWPLGRYLRSKIREQLGFKETGAQPGWEQQLHERTQEEMLELCISEGLIGLLKEEEATEETRAIKKIHSRGEWKKMLLERRNIQFNEQIELKEKQSKKTGRKL